MNSQQKMCQICRCPESEHDGIDIRHVFTPEGQRVDVAQFAPNKRKTREHDDDTLTRVLSAHSVSQRPFDPVLRTALIDAGVLTIQDLENAERKINLMTAEVTAPIDKR